MRMPNTEKVQKVNALAARFRAAQGTMFSDFRGLTVKDAMELRAHLRQHGASFVVAKNTLTRLAAKEAGLEGVDPLLEGPTGIVFADGDPIAGAKAFMEVARRFPALQLKGAYLEGHVFDEEQAKGLASIEAREVSFAKVAGLLQAPLARIAFVLQAPLQRIAYVLAERGRQAPEAEATTDSPEAEVAAEAPEADPTTEAPDAETTTEAPEAETTTEAPEAEATSQAPDAETTTEAPEAEAATGEAPAAGAEASAADDN
jgi:large subunit ribosomal protein L10